MCGICGLYNMQSGESVSQALIVQMTALIHHIARFLDRLPYLVSRLLLSERARSRGFLNNEFMASILHDHLEGKYRYTSQLFILASLELWFRVFIDNPRLGCPLISVEELLDDESVVAMR